MSRVRNACLVVGASGDLGQEIAACLIRDAISVVLTHSPGSAVPQFAQSVSSGTNVRWLEVDVRDSTAVTRAVTEAQQFVGGAVDLVYCAGVVRDSPLSLCSDGNWSDVIDINLTGAFYCIRAVSRELMVAGQGRIILVGSVSAQIGAPGQANYAAAKAGLEALARVAAVEYGRYGICVNVVSPGPIESSMVRDTPVSEIQRVLKTVPLGRLGSRLEVAEIVACLLGTAGAYITGQTILVDGGMTIT